MVLDQGDGAGLDLGAERARGIGQDQDLAAERLEGARQNVERGRRHPLVEVHPALQAGDRDAVEPAQHQPAGMTFDAWPRKARQIGVVERGGALDRVGDRAQARAQDETDPRREVGCPRPDHVDRAAAGGCWPAQRRIALPPGLGGPAAGLAKLERKRQKLAHGHGAPQAVGAAEVDRHVGAGELGQALAAAAAGGAQALAGGEHQRLGDPPLAGRDQRRERARLGAVALGIARVLDVGAGEDMTRRAAHRRAHPEPGIGRMGIGVRRPRGLQKILHPTSRPED